MDRKLKNKDIKPTEKGLLFSRVFWFVGLWLASITVLGIFAYALRYVLGLS